MLILFYVLQEHLYVIFVHLVEKILDAILIFIVMDHEEPDVGRSDERTDKPLIELVDNLEVHIGGLPSVLVDQV